MAKPKRFEEAHRHDVFRNFNFRILMGGVEVAACRKMSGLDVSVNAIKFRAGNAPSSVDECLPGRVEYQPVTFESGITNDTTLEDWAKSLVHNEWSQHQRSAEPDFRREVEVRILDLDQREVRRYVIHHCWPSKFTATNELDGGGNDVLIETLELQHEGFTRETPS